MIVLPARAPRVRLRRARRCLAGRVRPALLSQSSPSVIASGSRRRVTVRQQSSWGSCPRRPLEAHLSRVVGQQGTDKQRGGLSVRAHASTPSQCDPSPPSGFGGPRRVNDVPHTTLYLYVSGGNDYVLVATVLGSEPHRLALTAQTLHGRLLTPQ